MSATVQKVLEAAVSGVSLLPSDVLRALSEHRAITASGPDISDREVEWLRELAKGTTVAQLAERSGYSERAMFRLLRLLYARMQVQGRTEALMHAQQRGWLYGDRRLISLLAAGQTRVRGMTVVLVGLAADNTNLMPLVTGPVIELSERYAKLRSS
jgi:DNA-binding CsgD family transcriptional regulator